MENKVTADYLDEEGCLHCGICGKRKQMKVSLMGFEHVVSCLCECEVKARQELDEKMQREEAQRQLYQRKSVGLQERRFWEWKFEKDNGSNQKILIARQYVENWIDMKRKNVGLSYRISQDMPGIIFMQTDSGECMTVSGRLQRTPR